MRDYAAVLDEADLPEDVKWLVRYLFSEVLDGRNAHLTDGVQQALGRPATDYDEYVHRTAATGVWHVPGH
jgi:hypothetical protein